MQLFNGDRRIVHWQLKLNLELLLVDHELRNICNLQIRVTPLAELFYVL